MIGIKFRTLAQNKDQVYLSGPHIRIRIEIRIKVRARIRTSGLQIRIWIIISIRFWIKT